MELTDRNTVKALLERHGMHLKKQYGQNFLIRPEIPKRIAAHADRGCLEIGPGIGCMTAELCRVCEKVVAVEIDRSLLPVLDETLSDFDNVRVICDDILKVDLPALIAEEFGEMPVSVCANLPYYITTPILMYLLESGIKFSSITVMMQKEVADRLCAPAGHRDYGAISVVVDYYATCEKLFDVSPGSFLPPPKVTSTVVSLIPREAPPYPVGSPALFFACVKAAFGQRRKTLSNALCGVGGITDKEALSDLLSSCGIDPMRRGETLCGAEFARIADAIFAKRG